MASHPTVGILGGMGPEATVDLMRRVIGATPAEDDSDHIHMIVDNNPKVPSRMKALLDGNGEDPGPVLTAMAHGLVEAGAHVLAMPCNTAHAYLPEIEDTVSIPFLNMVTLTTEHVGELSSQPKRAGLLAMSAVHKVGLYEKAFAGHGIDLVIPEDQDDLMTVIKAVKAGDLSADVRNLFRAVTGALATRSDVLVIACTELSVLGDSIAHDVPVIDALDVLSDAIVSFGSSPQDARDSEEK